MRDESQKNYDNRFLFGFIKLFAVMMAIIIILFALFLTCRLKSVTVEGNSHYSTEELKDKVITRQTDQNAVLLYLRYKYGNVDSIPFVEDIDIELVNKNSIKIHVYEKVITGCIDYMGGYMYFDKDGMIVESSDVKLDEVPIVMGLKFNKIILYDKLEVEKKTIFDVILNITQLIRKYELTVQAIQFSSNLEVTLDCGNVKVLLGKREMYDEQLAELKNLLPSAKGKKITLDMINFTEGQDKIIATPQD